METCRFGLYGLQRLAPTMKFSDILSSPRFFQSSSGEDQHPPSVLGRPIHSQRRAEHYRATMVYRTVIRAVWEKILQENSARRPVTSRAQFEHVCYAFYQAENLALSYPESRDGKMFMAERNIWRYFCEYITLYDDRYHIADTDRLLSRRRRGASRRRLHALLQRDEHL